MHFVAGITGKTVGAWARGLLESAQPVRALVRDPKKTADCAERAFLMRPPPATAGWVTASVSESGPREGNQ